MSEDEKKLVERTILYLERYVLYLSGWGSDEEHQSVIDLIKELRNHNDGVETQ